MLLKLKVSLLAAMRKRAMRKINLAQVSVFLV